MTLWGLTSCPEGVSEWVSEGVSKGVSEGVSEGCFGVSKNYKDFKCFTLDVSNG